MNKKLEQAEELLKSRQGGDQTPKERAEKLRQQATTILQKSKGHLEAIEGMWA